jgi:hypothetical protein
VKKITLIITFFILFKPLFPIVEYVVNYEYVSKVLCVNKEKPELKCNGKCHLMKELAEVAENEKPISDNKIVVKEIEVLFYQELKLIEFSKLLVTKYLFLNANYSNLYTYLNSCSVFHPPSFIV